MCCHVLYLNLNCWHKSQRKLPSSYEDKEITLTFDMIKFSWCLCDTFQLALYVILCVLHNVSWFSAPWHSNNSEVHARAGAVQIHPQRSLLGSHSAWWTTQLNTFMTTHPELCPHDKWGKNSHNSLLDINDLWHLRWMSLQSHSAADLQGGISAGWIMPDMKGTKLQLKKPLKLPVCNINLLSRKHDQKTLSPFMHNSKVDLLFPVIDLYHFSPAEGSV